MKFKKNIQQSLPYIIYGIITVVIFGNALIPGPTSMLSGDDFVRAGYFMRQFLQIAFNGKQLPLWNPYTFSGMPFLESPQISPWYPVSWLYLFLPVNLALSFHYAFHTWFGMSMMFLLCKKFASKWASWISGITFGLSGWFMYRIYAGHGDINATCGWFALSLLLLWEAIENPKGKTIAKAACSVAIMLFAGYQTIALFAMWTIGFLFLFLCIKNKSIKPVIIGSICVLLGLGVSFIQLYPNQQYLSHTIRSFPLPQSWVMQGAVSWNTLQELFGFAAFSGPQPISSLAHERGMFVGDMTLFFICIAVVVGIIKFRRVEFWVAICTMFIGVWLSMGSYAPFDLFSFIRSHVSIYESMRIPGRHMILFVFGACMLSAMGLTWISQRKVLNKIKVHWILGLVVVVEMMLYAKQFIHTEPIPEARHDPELVKLFSVQDQPFRIFPYFNIGIPLRDAYDFDAPMEYKSFSATGYEALMLRNYYEFMTAMNKFETPRLIDYDLQAPYLDLSSKYIDMLNVKYVFLPMWMDILIGTPQSKYRLAKENWQWGYRVYENTQVLPRYYFVPQATILPNRAALLAQIRTGDQDPTKTVLLDKELFPHLSNNSSCQIDDLLPVKILHEDLNSVLLETTTHCDAYLVSSEVMYPGWQATIDGNATNVLEGNGAFRTLYVPQGKHTIVFQYYSWGFAISGVVSLSTLLMIYIFLWKTPRWAQKYV